MKKYDFYEFAGIILPGAVFLALNLYLVPDLSMIVRQQTLSFGDFGVFTMFAYVAGHLVQSFGNLIESTWWKLWGGWPTDWPRSEKRYLLGAAQRDALLNKVASLGLALPGKLSDIPSKDWGGIVKQVGAKLGGASGYEQVQIFNGNYGLFRGLAATFLICAGELMYVNGLHWSTTLVVLLVAFGASMVRMHRFGKHYARELYVQFLELKQQEKRK